MTKPIPSRRLPVLAWVLPVGLGLTLAYLWTVTPWWAALIATGSAAAAGLCVLIVVGQESARLRDFMAARERRLLRYEWELDQADAVRALVEALCATKRRSPAEHEAIRALRAHMLAAPADVEDVAA